MTTLNTFSKDSKTMTFFLIASFLLLRRYRADGMRAVAKANQFILHCIHFPQ